METTMKLDLIKEFPSYYKAKSKPKLVALDAANFICISGISAPENELFQNSIEAIYPVAYTVKKYYKNTGMDFKVPKMEAFWWVESEKPFDETPRADWHWQIMIRMPEFVTKSKVEEAIQEVIAKKHLSLVAEIEFKEISEGKSVQALHTGSYEEEASTISKIMGFMEQNNLQMNGYHHEIYLSDPRKTAEEKLRTILRYAVK